jgi:hypothetical protein
VPEEKDVGNVSWVLAAVELTRLVGATVNETGIGAPHALALFEHVLAPACITSDHPQYLAFIPNAPTKAATAFDLGVSATAVYFGSWMEGSGAVHTENEVLTQLANEFNFWLHVDGAYGLAAMLSPLAHTRSMPNTLTH